jgi:hypothetical protein
LNSGPHESLNLLKNLGAVLEEENLSLILRIGRIADNKNIADVIQLTLALSCDVLILFQSAVPKLSVGFANWALLTKSSAAILNEPTTLALKGVAIKLNERDVLALNRGKESNYRITILGSIQTGLPETIILVIVLGV